MNEVITTLESQRIRERVQEIHRSWSPLVREQRAREGRQRRAELLQLILKGEVAMAESTGRDAPCDRTARARSRQNLQTPLQRSAKRLGA